jgi:hypothetical protein
MVQSLPQPTAAILNPRYIIQRLLLNGAVTYSAYCESEL